jgi:hypothetical protein
MSTYQIGTTQGTLTNLSSLSTSVPDPQQTFKPYYESVNTGSGLVVGRGWAQDRWDFGYLKDAQRNALKAFCPNGSAIVYIQTYNDNLATPAWKQYRAVMVWTNEGEERRNDKRLKLVVLFKLLEDVTPS